MHWSLSLRHFWLSDTKPQLRAAFNLPSTTHPYWVNVLFFPDDAKESRIKFKQHVCDAAE
jgi:next-to-BRCA1 protein 1